MPHHIHQHSHTFSLSFHPLQHLPSDKLKVQEHDACHHVADTYICTKEGKRLFMKTNKDKTDSVERKNNFIIKVKTLNQKYYLKNVVREVLLKCPISYTSAWEREVKAVGNLSISGHYYIACFRPFFLEIAYPLMGMDHISSKGYDRGRQAFTR